MKDLRRTIDYLESRNDIDHDKLAYYGYSWGARVGSVAGAVEDRLKLLILEHGGTLERFTGDGMMIFFNDPVVVSDPAERALRMAVAMRERVNQMSVTWGKQGYDLSLGIGIAQGYATIRAIGFEERLDYGAVGAVTNLAARLCGEAKGGQILTNRKTLSQFEQLVEAESIGEVSFKGFVKPMSVYSIKALVKGADSAPR